MITIDYQIRTAAPICIIIINLFSPSYSSSINSIINFWLMISIFGYSYPQISIFIYMTYYTLPVF